MLSLAWTPYVARSVLRYCEFGSILNNAGADDERVTVIRLP